MLSVKRLLCTLGCLLSLSCFAAKYEYSVSTFEEFKAAVTEINNLDVVDNDDCYIYVTDDFEWLESVISTNVNSNLYIEGQKKSKERAKIKMANVQFPTDNCFFTYKCNLFLKNVEITSADFVAVYCNSEIADFYCENCRFENVIIPIGSGIIYSRGKRVYVLSDFVINCDLPNSSRYRFHADILKNCTLDNCFFRFGCDQCIFQDSYEVVGNTFYENSRIYFEYEVFQSNSIIIANNKLYDSSIIDAIWSDRDTEKLSNGM